MDMQEAPKNIIKPPAGAFDSPVYVNTRPAGETIINLVGEPLFIDAVDNSPAEFFQSGWRDKLCIHIAEHHAPQENHGLKEPCYNSRRRNSSWLMNAYDSLIRQLENEEELSDISLTLLQTLYYKDAEIRDIIGDNIPELTANAVIPESFTARLLDEQKRGGTSLHAV